MALIMSVSKSNSIKEKTPHQFITDIIKDLVKPENLKDKGIWAREYKICKDLIAKYPDKRIWVNFDFKMNSLAFLKTSEGQEEIKRIENNINYVVEEKEIIKLEKDKVGEDRILSKPLSIKEFLKTYNK